MSDKNPCVSVPMIGSFPTTGDGVAVGVGAVLWRRCPGEPLLIEGMKVTEIGGEAVHPVVNGLLYGGGFTEGSSPASWYSTPSEALRAAGGAK